ncbi:SCO1664 family protein [Nocardioides sp. R-C-SC26]|uniref:SCO1664 family protein n=1 Tax=Nocardioides sp. R-C-SC26 TaxID=2870414 RepID=UPI001E61694D|nr:SCO1664 family protein [Nocardioides sp. R-C-SC26]
MTAGLTLHGRVMPASNATFVGDLDGVRVVYKPVAGEQPLWDFPDGTLAGREVAAYLVSEAFGWDVVPRTWLGEGPHGLGMLQEWQESDPEQAAVRVVRPGKVEPGWRAVVEGVDDRDRTVVLVHEDGAALRRMAVFDVVTNNADRKGGHVLEMPGGHRYGVDHGLTFHYEPKLRTVLWGWHGESLTDDERDGVQRVLGGLSDGLADTLTAHLTDLEIECLVNRCEDLLDRGVLPAPEGSWPVIPWPPF